MDGEADGVWRKRGEDVQGAVIATPDQPRPYAVVVRRRRVILRSEPVESLAEGGRLLARLLAEAREFQVQINEDPAAD